MNRKLRKRLNALPTHCLAGAIQGLMSGATLCLNDAFEKCQQSDQKIFYFLVKEATHALTIFMDKMKLKNPAENILEDEAFKAQLEIYEKLQDEYWTTKCKAGTMLSFLGYPSLLFEVLGSYTEHNKPANEQVLVCRDYGFNSHYIVVIPKQLEAQFFLSSEEGEYGELLLKAPNFVPLKLSESKEKNIWEPGKVFSYVGYEPLCGNWETLFVLAHRGEPDNPVVIARKRNTKHMAVVLRLSEFTPADLPQIAVIDEPRQYVKRFGESITVLDLGTAS